MLKEFEKIIGYEGVKKELELICDIVKNFEKYEKLGVSFPGGILLAGEPGVGKTLMAKCFIEATGLKPFVCRKNKSNGEFVDEIKRVFDEAVKEAPSIVFLDDMDKFANEDSKHRDAEEYVTVQSCIDEAKGKNVFVIATVNELIKIPDSLWRVGRFDKTLYILSPVGEDAKKITKYYLSKLDVVENIDSAAVANLLDGSSCAMLETVINKAGMYAGFYNKSKIDMDDIVRAFLNVKYGMVDEENCENAENEESRIISIHESGHAAVAEILFPGSVNLVVASKDYINNHSKAFTSIARENIDIDPYKRKIYSVMIDLAGKAATEVMLNTIDIGCHKDMRHAFGLAEELVNNACAYGFDAFLRSDSGQGIADRKDYLVAKEVEKLYINTKHIIENNKEYVLALSKELLEKRVLIRSDIDRIKSMVNIKQ